MTKLSEQVDEALALAEKHTAEISEVIRQQEHLLIVGILRGLIARVAKLEKTVAKLDREAQ